MADTDCSSSASTSFDIDPHVASIAVDAGITRLALRPPETVTPLSNETFSILTGD